MLLHLRHNLAEGTDSYERTASDTDALAARGFASVMSSPLLLNLGRKVGRALLKPIARGGVVGRTKLPFLSRWTEARDLPVPPSRTFRDIWRDELADERGGDTRA